MTAVQRLEVQALTLPLDAPESDGTLEWDATTLVVVEAHADGATGLGWSYGDAAMAPLISGTLAGEAEGHDALAPTAAHGRMRRAARNLGQRGLGAMAISAVDLALWDLKARLLGLPLCALLGQVRDGVAVYGSGGFTSLSVDALQAQLGGWADAGLGMVKMKVGREPGQDPGRVRAAREAIGGEAELFVDANGAYGRAQAVGLARRFAEEARVTWLEEPVSSDDVAGLAIVRDRAPAGMAVAAGEYASTPDDLRALTGAVDVLQADVTRCGGITGLLAAGVLAEAFHLPLSTHCAPALHLHAACALAPLVHLEWFADHVRAEELLFEGARGPGADGVLRPDLARPGNGLALRREEAARFSAR